MSITIGLSFSKRVLNYYKKKKKIYILLLMTPMVNPPLEML